MRSDHEAVQADPIIEREDVRTLMLLVVDILTELRTIRRLLENGEEEEEGLRE